MRLLRSATERTKERQRNTFITSIKVKQRNVSEILKTEKLEEGIKENTMHRKEGKSDAVVWT
jgi:hypothetical protein